MKDLPFELSEEAFTWFDHELERAQSAHESAAMLPEICVMEGYVSYGEGGEAVEQFRSPFVALGWNWPESLQRQGHIAFELGRHIIFVHPEALKRLAGKTIQSELVVVGNSESERKDARLFVVRDRLSNETLGAQ